MLTFHEAQGATKGPAIVFDCPACGERGVQREPSETNEYVKIAYLVPVLKLRNTAITCSQCNAMIPCGLPLGELNGKDAAALSPHLRYHASPNAYVLCPIVRPMAGRPWLARG